jgi:fatty-acyl-CoA synthase
MGGPSSKYEHDLGKTPANFVPLTPLSFIERAAAVYSQRLSVVHGAQRYTWKKRTPVRGASRRRCRGAGSASATPWR